MKKVIIGLSVVAVLAVVVILFTNSRTSTPEVKKAATATTEMSKDCGKCPSAATCEKMTDSKGPACDMAKSKEAKGEVTASNEVKPAAGATKACCPEAKTDAKSCDPATCPMHATAK
jgi:hypothetical protein